METYLNEVQKENSKKIIDLNYDDLLFKNLIFKKNLIGVNPQVLILNFNYTNTFDSYLKKYFQKDFNVPQENFENVNIHGQLLDEKNPIIFGYGDEKEDQFSSILHDGNNELLRNVKHYKYSQGNNYLRLEHFFTYYSGTTNKTLAPFEVHILGHSCGNSDRTLFNFIFEQEHLSKNGVKIYLPDYEDEESKRLHYEDISIQISRTLNESGTVRSKLLNYKDCPTMPSIKKLKSRVKK